MGVWDDLAQEMGQEAEYSGSEWADLPDGAWCLGITVNNPKNGFSPKVERVEFTKGGETRSYYKFSMGLRAIGGDPSCEPAKHLGQYAAFSTSVEPNPERETKTPVAGKLKGIMNSLFACGVGGGTPEGLTKEEKEARTAKRSAVAGPAVGAIADKAGITQSKYPTKALFVAVGLKEAILGSAPKQVIFQVKHRDWESRAGKKGTSVEVSQFMDATVENLQAKAISVFPGGAEEAAGTEMEATF